MINSEPSREPAGEKIINKHPKPFFSYSVNLLFILIIASLFIITFVKTVKEKNVLEKVCVNNYCFYVQYAETNGEMARGLMGVKKMHANRGMLFFFEKVGNYPFWMKNTLIPLDIIWFDKDKTAVDIKRNVEPCKEDKCESIDSKIGAMYVLEINAGMADKAGIKLGDKLIMK